MTKEWLDMVAYHALGNRETQEATYDIAMLALQRGIPGDFVECGVFTGASSAIMVQAILDYYSWPISAGHALQRRVHLFDSFEGLPAATPTDAEIWAHHQDKTGESKCSIPEVQGYMHKWGIPPELLVYHPGWFEQTIPLFALRSHQWVGQRAGGDPAEAGSYEWVRYCKVCGIEDTCEDPLPPCEGANQIAVLRLDGDLYSSTSVAMKYLYPLVSPGGWVICDDYHLSGCKQAVHEVVNPGPIYWRKI